MIEVLAMLLVHVAPASPYHWHMSCSRWVEKSYEISRDPGLSNDSKRALIRYFRSKVDGDCDLA